MDIQEAIDLISEDIADAILNDKGHDAYVLAVKALQEQAKREKGCGIVYRHRHLGQFKYKTCPNCGEEIEIEHPTEIDAPYCGNCGKVILDAEQQYCGWCGKRLK